MIYRLCVCAAGSLMISMLSFITLIRVTCLHLGQNNGKILNSVSFLIWTRVLLLHTGHRISCKKF